jgi:hypothetical protein
LIVVVIVNVIGDDASSGRADGDEPNCTRMTTAVERRCSDGDARSDSANWNADSFEIGVLSVVEAHPGARACGRGVRV